MNERKKNILAVWQLSGFVLSQCSFMPLVIFFAIKTFEDEWYVVIKAYNFTILEILRDFVICIL